MIAKKEDFSNLQHQLPPGFGASPSDSKRGTSICSPFCSNVHQFYWEESIAEETEIQISELMAPSVIQKAMQP